jgi:RNA polymerase sigma-70 factor (ECF subfamily)
LTADPGTGADAEAAASGADTSSGAGTTPGADTTSAAGAGADVREAVARAHRREWARVLAATVRVARDLDLAEECAQDAYAQALPTWAAGGVPARPGAWLTTVARNRARDALRRESVLRSALPLLVVEDAVPGPEERADPPVVDDDRLRLIFTCCHPALSHDARVALTLRLVCGLSTAEVARAFLVQEPAMAARITRAKKKISAARIPYRVPAPSDLPERVGAVLEVVHLVFTVGHAAPVGEQLMRRDLVDGAVRLARTLRRLLGPDDGEVTGLLALMLLTDARRDTRLSGSGQLVLLADQDRTRWDTRQIAEGTALLAEALRRHIPSRYAVQAAIAAVHAEAADAEDTDWTEIVGLYDVLRRLWPSPVVELNRAVALGFRDGPRAGLAALAPLLDDPALATYGYLSAARADFLRRLERWAPAAAAYEESLAMTGNGVERAFLAGRLEEARAHLP